MTGEDCQRAVYPCQDVYKRQIVPRGQALGSAWYLPEERQITTKEQMLDEMCSLMGGRAAEELFL